MSRALFLFSGLGVVAVLLFGRFDRPFPYNLLAWVSLGCMAASFILLVKLTLNQRSRKQASKGLPV